MHSLLDIAMSLVLVEVLGNISHALIWLNELRDAL